MADPSPSPFVSSPSGTAESETAYISLLSDDILYDILHLAIASSWESYERRQNSFWENLREHHPGVVEFSSVSRSWRLLALRLPVLWSYLFIQTRFPAETLRVFLARSACAPLHVLFEESEDVPALIDNLTGKAQLLAGHAHRIVELRTNELRAGDMNMISEAFREVLDAPVLCRLKLVVKHSFAPATAPRVLFPQTMPVVQEITVRGVPVLWTPHEGLTVLDLGDLCAPPLSHLIWTLRRCPQLRVLKLGLDSSLPAGSAPSSSDIPVSLACLQTLYIRAGHVDMIAIMSRITFPASSTVMLATPAGPTDLSQVCPSLRAITEQIHTISINVAGEFPFVSYLMVTLSAVGPCNAVFRLEWPREIRVGDDPRATFLLAVSLPALRHLSIIGHPVLTQAHWTQVLESAAALTSIEVWPDMLDFLRALGGELDSPLARLPCPTLERLVIVQTGREQEYGAALEDVLRGRASRGACLKQLEISLLTDDEDFKCSSLRGLCESLGIKLVSHKRFGASGVSRVRSQQAKMRCVPPARRL